MVGDDDVGACGWDALRAFDFNARVAQADDFYRKGFVVPPPDKV